MLAPEATVAEAQQHRNQLEKHLDEQTAELTAITENVQQKNAQCGHVDNEPQEHREQVGSDTEKSETEMAELPPSPPPPHEYTMSSLPACEINFLSKKELL